MATTRANSLRLDLPGPVRLLNRTLDPFDGIPGITFEEMARAAEGMVRLDDWGSDDQRARFVKMARANSENPNISPWGRIATRILVQWHMVNHLRRVAHVKANPSVRDVAITAPLVILGFYRTGTTLLHNVLAADPRNRLPRTWEMSMPLRVVDDDALDAVFRRVLTMALLNANTYVVPEQATAHAIEVNGAEECFFLFENAGVSTTHINTFEAYDYAWDLLASDLRPLYEDHKLQLQILRQAGDPRRFALKCPFHLWNLPALLSVYPDARILWTHREVARALPSNCSLSAMTTSKFVRRFDATRLGRFWLDFFRAGLERGLEARASIPDEQIADIRLHELARDPGSCLRGAYERLGLPCDDMLEAAFRAAANALPREKHGEHVYDLSQFGLDPTEVSATFADYHARFGLV